MNNEVKLFENPEFGNVRVIMRDGEPWFVARDVAKALGYADTTDAIRRHCEKLMISGAVKCLPPLRR